MHKSKVIKNVDMIALTNVELRVRKGGLRRAKKENQRNVHAFCIGTEIEINTFTLEEFEEVTYNPFLHNSFVIKSTQRPVFHCDFAILYSDKLYIPK